MTHNTPGEIGLRVHVHSFVGTQRHIHVLTKLLTCALVQSVKGFSFN